VNFVLSVRASVMCMFKNIADVVKHSAALCAVVGSSLCDVLLSWGGFYQRNLFFSRTSMTKC
jgi:hypothetical protein